MTRVHTTYEKMISVVIKVFPANRKALTMIFRKLSFRLSTYYHQDMIIFDECMLLNRIFYTFVNST